MHPMDCCSSKKEKKMRSYPYIIELSSILITIGKMNVFSKNDDISTNNEIFRNDKSATPICSKDFLSFQKSSLRDATILKFRFCDGNRIILQVIEDDDLSNSIIFKCRFYYRFFEIAIKSNFNEILFIFPLIVPQNMSIHFNP